MDKYKVSASDSVFLVIDVQERLFGAMDTGQRGRLLDNVVRLGRARQALSVSSLLTEQYPKGLGATLPLVQEAFTGEEALAKTCFDALADETIHEKFTALGKKTVIVAGMETHVCVFQTVRTLIAADYRVHVLADAVASRSPDNYERGLALCEKLGAVVTSTETVLFDMVEKAGSDAFKTVSKLVR